MINASQGLGMEKVLRACSHPPLTALNSRQSLVQPRSKMSQEPGASLESSGVLHNGEVSPGSQPGRGC